MADPAIQMLADAGATIGESPIWQGDTAIWTDPVERRLLRFQDDTQFGALPVAHQVWSLAALPDGSMVGALDDRFCRIEPSGAIIPGATASLPVGSRFNDMTADLAGGLWAGVMHRGILATRGAIYHASSLDAEPRRVADGLGVPNGMKVSGDGRTLYAVDTLARSLLAYPIAAGELDEPVIVSDFLSVSGKPDGMTIAADGSFWVAMWGGACVVQLASDGAILREIAVPAPHVSSLCFAAPDRLLVTTSRLRLSPGVLATHPGSGGLFEIRL